MKLKNKRKLRRLTIIFDMWEMHCIAWRSYLKVTKLDNYFCPRLFKIIYKFIIKKMTSSLYKNNRLTWAVMSPTTEEPTGILINSTGWKG